MVKCEPIRIEKGAHGYDPGDAPHYQSTIRLVTGRKHQVRAQLAALGCPIVRDTLYQPMSGLTLDRLEGEGEENSDSDVCMNRSIKTQKRATMATLSVESKTPRSSFADNTPHLVVFSGGTAFNSIAKVLGEKLSTRVTYVLPVSATPDLSWRYWGE